MKKLFILFLLFSSLAGISQTKLTAPAVRNNSLDTYNTHFDSLGNGGFMALADTFTRNALPDLVRKRGMLVSVQDTIYYSLIGGIANVNWVRVYFSTNPITYGPGVDSVRFNIPGQEMCVWSGGLADCYKFGKYYDSTAFNSDSTYEYHYSRGNFLDSVWVPKTPVFPGINMNFRDTSVLVNGNPVRGKIFDALTSGDYNYTWQVQDSVSAQPTTPQIGYYLVGTSPTGTDFPGHANDIGYWDGSVWTFEDAAVGNVLFNLTTYIASRFDIGDVWVQIPPAPTVNWWSRVDQNGNPGQFILIPGQAKYGSLATNILGLGHDVFHDYVNGSAWSVAIGPYAQHHNNSLGQYNTSIGAYAMPGLSGAITGSNKFAAGFLSGNYGYTNWSIDFGYNSGYPDDRYLSISDSTIHMYFKLDSASGTAPSVIGKDALGRWHTYVTPSGGSGSQTFQQVFDQEVGGALLTKKDTILFGSGTNLNFQGNAGFSTPLLLVDNNGFGEGLKINNLGGGTAIHGFTNSGAGVWGEATGSGNDGVFGTSDSRYGINGTSVSGSAIRGYSTGQATIRAELQKTSTNTVEPVIDIRRTTTTTPLDGIGSSIDYYQQAIFGAPVVANQLKSWWSDITNKTSRFSITGLNNASTEDFAEFQVGGIVLVNNGVDTLATNAYARSLGGGGGGGASSQVKRVHEIATMGNSMTANGGYQTQISALLNDTSWVIRNYGVSGDATSQMVGRMSSVTKTAPDYVIVMGGVNDIVNNRYAIEIETNLQTMYTAFHNAGSKVVAVTILPFGGNVNWTSGKQATQDSVRAFILAGPPNVDYVIDAFAALENPSQANHLNPTYSSGDSLHPNAGGYTQLGSTIYTSTTFTKSGGYQLMSFSGNLPFNQNVSSLGSPNFKDLTLSTLTVINRLNGSIPMPQMTTSQIAAIPTTAKGMMAYDTTLGLPMHYTGTEWSDRWYSNIIKGTTSLTFKAATASATGNDFKWLNGANVERLRLTDGGFLGLGATPFYGFDINGMSNLPTVTVNGSTNYRGVARLSDSLGHGLIFSGNTLDKIALLYSGSNGDTLGLGTRTGGINTMWWMLDPAGRTYYLMNGIGTTRRDAINIVNSTAAANGAQQYPGAIHMGGQGWNTTLSASQPADWYMRQTITQGTAISTAWILSSSVNGGGLTDRLTISSSGTITTPGNFSATGSSTGVITGNKFNVSAGTNISIGTATLVAGTVTVTTAAAATASQIFLTVKTPGGTQGFLSYTVSNGVNFTVTSTNPLDTSTFNWWIIN